VYRNVGLNEAARRIGCDKKTILRWAADAGLDNNEVTFEVSERNRRAAQAGNARIARERAAARERVVTRLVKLSEAATVRELELVAGGGFTREDLQAVTNSRMKAIQQLELLEGRATSRNETLIDADFLISGAAAALRIALELVPSDLRQAITERFAHELYQVREEGLAALEAGDVEDGEILEETEEAAA
jgi:hypothetical protein